MLPYRGTPKEKSSLEARGYDTQQMRLDSYLRNHKVGQFLEQTLSNHRISQLYHQTFWKKDILELNQTVR